MYAARNNLIDLVQLLIDKGANLAIKDKDRRTARTIAAKWDNHQVVAMLDNKLKALVSATTMLNKPAASAPQTLGQS